MNGVFVDSLNGLNLSSLLNIDEIDTSSAEDILSHLLKIKRDLVSYSEQLKALNNKMKKLEMINRILELVVGESELNDDGVEKTNLINSEEIDEMVKRLDSLNVESINKIINPPKQ